MGKNSTLVTNEDLTVLLKHLREHYWCLEAQMSNGDDYAGIMDDFWELSALLQRYRADLEEV